MGASSQHNDGPHSSLHPSSRDEFAKPSHPEDDTVLRSDDASVPSGEQKPLRELPAEFGRYRIVRVLGRGGMGVVYLAHDSQLDRDVALKVPQFVHNAGQDVIERFYREARAMGTLHHPHLCPVYDVGEHDGIHYLTMAYISGRELSAILKDPAEANRLDVVSIVRKVALALEEAHQAGLVHRDLKPSNIMLDRRGDPVVMDFGLARRNRQGEAEITQSGAIVGTPAYMSPEQFQGDIQHVGPRSDVYSLGVIFYQLLCQRLPFEGDLACILAQVLTKDPKPPSQFYRVDPVLESLCLRAMAKQPDGRFASMAELVQALDEFQAAPELSRARIRRQESAARRSVVPGYRHDVLVAYFGSDDEPPPGSHVAGWVTTLVDHLDWRLRQLTGVSEALSVCMEEPLARDPKIDGEFAQKLDQSATVLLVVSPGWIGSARGPEIEFVLKTLRQRHLAENRVFLVERDRVPLESRPKEIAALRGIAFWKAERNGPPRVLGYPQPKPEMDLEYYARIDDLARTIHDRLSSLGSLGSLKSSQRELEPTVSLPSQSGLPDAVFLAEVTDDLDPLRDEVARYLNQSGFRVFPQTWYARDPDEFRHEMQRDLAECLLFVQLLGPFAGKKPPGSSESYARIQHELAAKSGLSVMQWRDVQLNPGSVHDADHRGMVNGLHVQAVELEQFKRDVVRGAVALREKRQAALESDSANVQDQAFVFINIERGDLPLADDLCDLLERNGYSYALPMHEGRPDEIRQDLEANLLDCDGLIVVYGEITEQWVREQLRQWRKILYRREKPLRALAVYEGPPEEKQRLGMKLPKMHVIDCRQGMQEDKVLTFLRTLGGR